MFRLLLLIVALLPTYLIRFSIFGIPTTFLEILVLILIVWWLATTKGKLLLSLPRKLQVALVLVFLAATVAAFVAPDTRAALGIWKAYFIEPMLLFLVVRDIVKTKEDWGKIFAALGVSALAVSVIAIVQFIINIGIPSPWDVERRVTSVFPYPNAVGLFLGPVIVIGVAIILDTVKKYPLTSPYFRGTTGGTKTLWLWCATILLGLVATIMAQSEAAIAAVIITLFVASLFSRLRRFSIPLVIISLIVISLIAPARSFLVEKITLQDFSGIVRRAMWTETVEMLKDRPLLGAGLSGYKTIVAPYHKHQEWEIFQYPHQIILNIWTELGALGLIAFVYVAVLVARVILPLFKSPPLAGSRPTAGGELEWVTSRGVTVIAFFALFEMLLHGLVDVPYFKNDLAVMTWLLLAAVFINLLNEKKPT